MQPITDYNEFFNGARAAITEQQSLDEEVKKLADSVRELERELDAEKKALDNEVNATVKKRRSEVSSTYDDQVESSQKDLAKAKSRREKAKNQGIKDRIAEETAPARHENVQLSEEISDIVKKKRLPFYCNSDLYYSLYYPSGIGDILKIIAFIIVFFALIPYLVYRLIGKEEIVYLVVCILGAIVLFGGIATLIRMSTVAKYDEALRNIRALNKKIRANKLKINDIAAAIRNDKNEDVYDLAQYDDEIASIEQKIADSTFKKQDALNNFDTVTKTVITDEINEKYRESIKELTARLDANRARYKELSDEKDKNQQYLSSNYEVYLGKEFMNIERIEKLSEIINHGTATNISEAISEYKNRMDD